MLKQLILFTLLGCSSMTWADAFYDKLNNFSQIEKLNTADLAEYKKYLTATDWRKVFETDDFIAYIHYQSVDPMIHGMVKVWEKQVYLVANTDEKQQIGDYSLTSKLYDCKKRQYLLLSEVDYDKSGKVKAEFDFSSDAEIHKIAPKSFGEAMLNNACSYGYIKANKMIFDQ